MIQGKDTIIVRHLIFSMSLCFYGNDMINLVSGGQRSISHLKVGDRVWSINHDGTSLFEDEVMLCLIVDQTE